MRSRVAGATVSVPKVRRRDAELFVEDENRGLSRRSARWKDARSEADVAGSFGVSDLAWVG